MKRISIYYDFNFVSWSYPIHIECDDEVVCKETRTLQAREDKFIGIDVATDILYSLNKLKIQDCLVTLYFKFVYDFEFYTKNVKFKNELKKLQKADNLVVFQGNSACDIIREKLFSVSEPVKMSFDKVDTTISLF